MLHRAIWSERKGLSAVPCHRRRNACQIETTRVNACLDGAMPPKTEPRLTEIQQPAAVQCEPRAADERRAEREDRRD